MNDTQPFARALNNRPLIIPNAIQQDSESKIQSQMESKVDKIEFEKKESALENKFVGELNGFHGEVVWSYIFFCCLNFNTNNIL